MINMIVFIMWLISVTLVLDKLIIIFYFILRSCGSIVSDATCARVYIFCFLLQRNIFECSQSSISVFTHFLFHFILVLLLSVFPFIFCVVLYLVNTQRVRYRQVYLCIDVYFSLFYFPFHWLHQISTFYDSKKYFGSSTAPGLLFFVLIGPPPITWCTKHFRKAVKNANKTVNSLLIMMFPGFYGLRPLVGYCRILLTLD